MKRGRIILSGAALIVLAFLTALFLPRVGQFQAAAAESKARASVAVGQESQGGEGYVSPIDFEALQKHNGDIYAWLCIPGTEISEPLLQHKEDDQYYLSHNSIGAMTDSGALFTEGKYNSKEFNDPATVIYGKNTWTNRLFSGLQAAFSSNSGFQEHREVIVYLPRQEIHYTVFAAVPFRNYHLLHYFSFKNENRYRMFLEIVDSIRTVDAHRDQSVEVTPEDQLLILSTNRTGSSNTCYLVLAKRT